MKTQAKSKDPFRWRLALVAGGLMVLAGAILGRAFVFQVVESERLAELARQEYRQTITLTPSRGIIRDRQGVVLAASVQVDSVYARPERLKDKRAASSGLAKALGLSRRAVLEALNRDQPFVWLRRQVEPEVAGRVRALNLAGVDVVPENRRYYPQRELAAHLLGFAGLDAQGLEGLEKAYDRALKGRLTRVWRSRDASGRPIYDRRQGRPPVGDGNDLILTLDKGIQYLAEKALGQAVAEHQAKGGLVVVLAPRTGELLASAAAPTFNPNVYASYPAETWRNRVITDAFEPGSMMKIFTLAAALEEGLVSPNTVIKCESGAWRVGGRVIHDVHPFDQLKLSEVLSRSSNIGAAKIGLSLGPRRLHRLLTRFGFDHPTEIDLPGESAGLINPAKRWQTIDTATASFGQGLSVTALQFAAAVAAVANGGVYMRPYVVSEIRDPQGRTIRRRQPQPVGRVMSARTAALMTAMMEEVVTAEGTGSKAAIEGYRVAGKTGTAQKLDPKTGTYSRKLYQASFVGFLPAQRPELVILVVIDEPQGSIYGGQVAAPAFKTVAEGALPLLGIPGGQRQLIQAKHSPMPGALPVSASRDEIDEALRQRRMPRLEGLSLRQALGVLSRLGLECVVEGEGYVVDQDPKPGQGLSGVKGCRLRLTAEMS